MDNKVWGFVKNHKKELAIAGVSAVIGGVVFAVTRKKPVLVHCWTRTCDDIPIPELSVGTVNALWKEDGYIDTIVNNIPIASIGEFFEELVKNVEQINPDGTIDAVVGFTAK